MGKEYHNRNETKIQKEIQEYLKSKGCYEIKIHR